MKEKNQILTKLKQQDPQHALKIKRQVRNNCIVIKSTQIHYIAQATKLLSTKIGFATSNLAVIKI